MLLSINGKLFSDPLCLGFYNEGEGHPASITTMVKFLFPSMDIEKTSLPQNFKNLLNVQIEQLCLNRKTKTFTASVIWPKTIEIVPTKPGFLSLTNTKVKVTIDASSKPTKFGFSVESTTRLGKIPLKVTLAKGVDGSWYFEATLLKKSVTLGEIAAAFGSPGRKLRTALVSMQLHNTALANVHIKIKKDPKLYVNFIATVSFRELKNVHFELIVDKPFSASALTVFGVRTQATKLASILKSILPSVNIANVPFLESVQIPTMAAMFVSGAQPSGKLFRNRDLDKLAGLSKDAKVAFLLPVMTKNRGRQDILIQYKKSAFYFKVCFDCRTSC